MSLRKFGHGGTSIDNGDLSHHIGWLEGLCLDEEENITSTRPGPKQKRLDKVRSAIALLYEADEMGGS